MLDPSQHCVVSITYGFTIWMLQIASVLLHSQLLLRDIIIANIMATVAVAVPVPVPSFVVLFAVDFDISKGERRQAVWITRFNTQLNTRAQQSTNTHLVSNTSKLCIFRTHSYGARADTYKHLYSVQRPIFYGNSQGKGMALKPKTDSGICAKKYIYCIWWRRRS